MYVNANILSYLYSHDKYSFDNKMYLQIDLLNSGKIYVKPILLNPDTQSTNNLFLPLPKYKNPYPIQLIYNK